MGGDHGHGHGHGHGLPEIPNYKIYRIEDAPELVQVRNALAAKGLKSPWLRNDVWRYNRSMFPYHTTGLWNFLFRGFKFGFAAFLVTIAVEKFILKDDHGHGHGNDNGHDKE